MGKLIGVVFAVTTLLSLDLSAANSLPASEMIEPLQLGTQYKFQSKILKEERILQVRLPQGYAQSNEQYPVVYVLDAELNFAHLSIGAGKLEEYGRMPPSIIVGVPNTASSRMRDLMNEKEVFREFIRTELLTFIDGNFRTSGMRTLYGHSLAGYFTASVLAEEKNLFDNYIIASPTLQVNNFEVVKKLEALFRESLTEAKSLYLSFGNPAEEGRSRTSAVNQLAELLNARAPSNLHWRYDPMPEQIHITTGYITAYKGLSHVFKDYQALAFESVEAFDKAGGMKAVEQHFQARADKYGLTPGLSESMYISLGYMFLYEDDDEEKHRKAIQLLSESMKHFPDSIVSIEALGRALYRTKKLKEAKALFEKGLKIAKAENQSGFVSFFKIIIDRIDNELEQ